MPLFSNQYKGSQANKKAEIEKRLKQLAVDYRNLWDQEDALLRSYGVPVPKRLSDFIVTDWVCSAHKKPIHIIQKDYSEFNNSPWWESCCTEKENGWPKECYGYIEITLPAFEIPNHMFFRFGFYHGQFQDNKYIFSFLPFPKDYIEEKFQTTDLYELMSAVPFMFFNRDPYRNYKRPSIPYSDRDNEHIDFTERIAPAAHGLSLNPHYTSVKLGCDPLVKTEGFSTEDLRNLIAHRKIYFDLARSYYRDKPSYSYDWMVEGWPDNRFSVDPITLKLIPPPETKISLTEQLFENLRRANHPIAFEIASEETIFYCLTFDPKDSNLIQEQLQLYFPTCGIQMIVNCPLQYYRISVKPEHFDIPLRTLSKFGTDPYNQLWAVLEKSNAQSPARLQFIIKPYSDAALGKFCSDMEHRFRDSSDKKIMQSIKNYRQKLLPWIVSINLFAADPQLLTRLLQNFLLQFKTPDQEFLSYDPAPILGIDYLTDLWSVLSNEEVATLAHFPTQTPNSNRIEVGSMKAKLPPSDYIFSD